jgi:hypothetical protein
MNATKTSPARTRKTEAPAQAAPETKGQATQAAPAEPTPVSCHCGCGTDAKLGRRYLPGHDARHAGQVGRALAEGKGGAQEALAALPPKLREKAERFAANRERETKAKAARAELRQKMTEELAEKLAAL